MIAECIAHLLSTIDGLDDIGNVLDYFPADAKTGQLAKAAFASDNEIKTCIIRRKTAEEDSGAQNFSRFLHTIWIEHLRSYGGQTEQHTYDAVIDAILTALAQDKHLGGTVAFRSPARLTISEPRLFYKYLCHYGRIELVVNTILS